MTISWRNWGLGPLRLGWSVPAAVLGAAVALLAAAPGWGEIVSVVGNGAGVVPSMEEAELSRLKVLLGMRQPEVISEISPDGSTLVVAVSSSHSFQESEERHLYFLDLRTGELSDALALEYDLINPELPLHWVDNDTLRYVQHDPFGPWEIITINRETAIASRTRVYPVAEEDGEVLGVAPDFSKFALRLYGETEDIIYIVFLPSLRRLEVARLPQDLEILPPTWSANGDRVALVTTAGEQKRLYDRTPYSPSLGTPVVQDALGRLAPAENPFYQHSGVRVFDFSQAAPLQLELLARDHGSDAFAGASLSPDGQRLLLQRHRPSTVAGRSHPSYTFPEAAYYQIVDLEGTVIDTLTADPLRGPLETAGQFWGNDHLLLWGTHGLNRHLYRYDLSQRQLTPLPLPPGSVDPDSIAVSQDGTTVVYGFSSLTQPPELFIWQGEATPQSLTHFNREVAAANRVRVEEINFTTRQGNWPGLLIQPAGHSFPPRGVPIVFWQQGGPGASMANEFATAVEMPLNLLPNFGLAVLVVPLMGREGFGPEVYRALADPENFGRIDVETGAEILAQMVQRGWTTPPQVGITGCSYGGYYAAQMITRFPQVVGAANPQCSLLDTLTEWQLGYSSLLSYLVGQTPMETPDTYLRISPLYNAQSIRTPTLLFHGAEDFLQIDVARNFHDVIAGAGVPVMLYEFEGVGHSLYGSGYQTLAAQLQLDFFRRYLQPQ
jgi:dipeptidyl aminopeptidase/acylaminoacyl peptidase